MRKQTREKISQSLKRHHKQKRIKRRMSTAIISIGFLAWVSVLGHVAQAQPAPAPEPEPVIVTRADLEVIEVPRNAPQEYASLIYEISQEYNVDYTEIVNVIDCETAGTWDAEIQSGHILSYGREKSYGLSQWHLPSQNRKQDGTLITYEDAIDPETAIETMAWYFSEGKQHLWTCWRLIYQ